MNLPSSRGGTVVLENKFVRLTFNVKTGLLDVYDLKDSRPYPGDMPSYPLKEGPVLKNAFSSFRLSDGTVCNSCDDYSKTCESEDEGSVQKTIFRFRGCDKKPDFALSFQIYRDKPVFLASLEIENTLAHEIAVDEATLLEVSNADRGGILKMGTVAESLRFFRFGFHFLQHWKVVPVTPGSYDSFCGGLLKDIKSGKALTAGFINFSEGVPKLVLACEKDYSISNFQITLYMNGRLRLKPGEIYRSEELYLSLENDENKALADFAGTMSDKNKVSLWPKTVQGWGPWYSANQTITEGFILEQAEKIRRDYKKYGVEYVEIDCGWEIAQGDWEPNGKFPHGMKWLADRIKEMGLKPGLWYAPFQIADDSSVYREHPDWLLRDEKGELVYLGPWTGGQKRYPIDITHPDAVKYLVETVRKFVHEWGMEYIKPDFLYGCFGVNFHGDPTAVKVASYNNNMTFMRAYQELIKNWRKTAGPDVHILNCIGYIFNSPHYAGSTRVEYDISYDWETTKRCARENILNSFWHKRVWLNDPDLMILDSRIDDGYFNFISRNNTADLGGKKISNRGRTLDEARFWATIVALSGGTVLWGDNLLKIDPLHEEIARKVLIPYGKAAVPVNLMADDPPKMWNLAVSNEREEWKVTAVFNYDDNPSSREVKFPELGLSESKEYHVFEFWNEKYLGIHRGKVLLEKMPPHSASLLAIKEAASIPRLISTSLHYTQGAVEIGASSWNGAERELTLTLRWPERVECKLYVSIPPSLEIKGVENAKLEKTCDGLAVISAFAEDGKKVIIKFSNRRKR